MTETTAQPQIAAKRVSGLVLFGVLGSAAIFSSGCAAARKRPAIPWSTAVLVRPIAHQQSASLGSADDAAPDLKPEILSPPAPLALGRTGPARPRIPALTTNPNARAAQPDTPQIVPELSAEQSASLQKEVDHSVSASERNLAATSGKSLNATQADLVSKVRSFIFEAQDAGRAGDWARARDLAKKAQVLSEELVASL
jgi:hypothetical protein